MSASAVEVEVISWALILLAAGDVAVTLVLVRAAQRLHNAALSERAFQAVVLTVAGVIWATFAIIYLADVDVPRGITALLLVLAATLVSVPQFIWFALYWTGRFR
jgi:hypothetical protein